MRKIGSNRSDPAARRNSVGRPRGSRARARRAGLAAALLLAGALLALLPLLDPGGPAPLPPADGAALAAKPDKRVRAADACPEGSGMRVNGATLCSHGPDPAPPGVDVGTRAAPARRVSTAAERVACLDDGVSGPRVQVLYVYPEGGTSAYARYLASFRFWVDRADRIFLESAMEGGGMRQVRFVTGPDCQVDVRPVAVPASSLGDFWDSTRAVAAHGYNRTDRKYLMFVDAHYGLCGVGSIYGDDRPGAVNANNRGPGYARVDAGCWNSPTVVAHELMHTLGGVQNSAPNSSRAFHCVDTFDVMCYSDAPYFPTMILACDDSRLFEARFDCNDDDYFSTSPRPGSYLATHWNAADSVFLYDPNNPRGGPAPPPNPGNPTVRASVTARPKPARVKRALTLSLRGFAAGERVTVRWPAAGLVRTATVSPAGTGSLRVVVPGKTKRGRATIVATGARGSRAQTSVTVKGPAKKQGARRAAESKAAAANAGRGGAAR